MANATELENLEGAFSAGFAGFWWSHVPKRELASFLSVFHLRLEPGAKVVFVDNRYVEGSSTTIAYRDEEGNTYQDRTLENGRCYRIIKNFPAEGELRAVLRGRAESLEIASLKYYWCASYQPVL